jgi:hypothetical protein
MKTITTVFFSLIVAGMVFSASAAEKLQHVVCVKFKETATSQDIKNVEEAFGKLKGKIPQISGIEWGTNISKENRDKGFTHCFIISFKDEKDRDVYLEHEAHKAFVKEAGPFLGDVFVIDFWVKK